jgi:long-chain fatty acid transport protein
MRNKFAAIILFANISFSFLFAGGFQVNLQGNRSTGMGHNGVGLRLGAESGFFNPGALAFSRTEVLIGINLIASHVGYRELQPGIYEARNNNGLGTPFHGYFAIRPTEDSPFVIGLAAYTPFGSAISYEDDWKLQAALRSMSLRAIFYQGTLAYQVNDRLGIGAGYVFATGDFALRRAVPIQDANGNFGEANLSGAGTGHGFNVGIYYDIADNISLGVSYRSGVGIDLQEGQARFDVPPILSSAFPDTRFTSGLNLPSVFNVGIAIKASDKLTLAAEMNYVGWSSYDTLSFDFEENTPQLQDVNSPRRYKNVVILRAGAEYEFRDEFTLRAGMYYDFTPVQDGFMTPETPDMDRIGLTIGATYRLSNFEMDASFLYVVGGERTDTNLEQGFSGRWYSTAFIPGISLRYKF